MEKDLTQGKISSSLWKFALPLMAGNILQQFYNLTDTWIVGRYIGPDALAAVGASYSLMTFLNSILTGLSMGSAAFFSIEFGRKNFPALRNGVFVSFILIGGLSLVLTAASLLFLPGILHVLSFPAEVQKPAVEYLQRIFLGIPGIFLYNFFANFLRALGNSASALFFLGISVLSNVFLDLLFILGFSRGVGGAAEATVLAQYLSAAGIVLYCRLKMRKFLPAKSDMHWERQNAKRILFLSFSTGAQQSVMNFGILMVQGLVNSFGAVTMAAFAAAVKIDTLAYMPAQDLGNAYSTFTAQNYGAQKFRRIRQGTAACALWTILFCLAVGAAVFIFARPLMYFFVGKENAAVAAQGAEYLRVEGAFYSGIGILFLLYGFFRAVGKPAVSLLLTVISLGTRVALAYTLSATALGRLGIWWSIPIGWALADAAGLFLLFRFCKKNAAAFCF